MIDLLLTSLGCKICLNAFFCLFVFQILNVVKGKKTLMVPLFCLLSLIQGKTLKLKRGKINDMIKKGGVRVENSSTEIGTDCVLKTYINL